jgi:hypothetical protein
MEIPVERPIVQSKRMACVVACAIAAMSATCSRGWAASEQTPAEAARKPAPVAPPPPSPEEQAKLLETVRGYALHYAETLPDFICLEQNRRYTDSTGLGQFLLADVLTARLSFFNQREEYKLVSQNGRAVANQSYSSVEGAFSMGDFGTGMHDIFDPASQAAFAWKRWTVLRGRLAHVYSFRIPVEHSQYSIEYRSGSEPGLLRIKVAYRGSIFVDKDLNMVVRIEQEAVNIPPSFPIKQAQATLDYDFTTVGDREFFLPLVATLELHARADAWSRNVKEFRNYQKFSADAVIKFDGQELPPLPDEKTKEQAPRKVK